MPSPPTSSPDAHRPLSHSHSAPFMELLGSGEARRAQLTSSGSGSTSQSYGSSYHSSSVGQALSTDTITHMLDQAKSMAAGSHSAEARDEVVRDSFARLVLGSSADRAETSTSDSSDAPLEDVAEAEIEVDSQHDPTLALGSQLPSSRFSPWTNAYSDSSGGDRQPTRQPSSAAVAASLPPRSPPPAGTLPLPPPPQLALSRAGDRVQSTAGYEEVFGALPTTATITPHPITAGAARGSAWTGNRLLPSSPIGTWQQTRPTPPPLASDQSSSPSSQASRSPPAVVRASAATSQGDHALRRASRMREGDASGPSHLPVMGAGTSGPTSFANWDVSQDLESAISRLVGEHVLDDSMNDKRLLKQFRDHIIAQDHGPSLLDFFNDVKVLADLSLKVRLGCSAIEQVYLLKDSPQRLALPLSIRGPVLESLHSASGTGLGLMDPQRELLHHLYRSEFRNFVQTKLVKHVAARLSQWKIDPISRDGLADCFCLSNPRLRDHPIVLASEGFSQLTGYPIDAIVGRNCRFLQGPGTDADSVARIRQTLEANEPVTSLIVNYRANGEPFLNLLCVLPLTDAHSETRFFLGGQIDVSGTVASLVQGDSRFLSATPPQPFSAGARRMSVASTSSTTPARSNILASVQGEFTPSVRTYQEAIFSQQIAVGGHSAGLYQHGSAFLNARPQQVDDSTTLHIRAVMSDDTTARDGPSGERSDAREETTTRRNARGDASGGASMKKEKTASGRRVELGLTPEEHERGMAQLGPSQLQRRLSEFETTYSRIVIVRQEGCEILFMTPEVLTFCDLGPSTAHSLVGSHFTKILRSAHHPPHVRMENGAKTVADEAKQRVRRNVRSAIEKGHSYSTPIGLLPQLKKSIFRPGTSNGSSADHFRACTLHLTPLLNRDGRCEAFVAIFG